MPDAHPVVVDPAVTIQYLTSGKADIAAGDWYRTAERGKVLDLSGPTYLDQMGIYSKDGTGTIAAMVNKQVGTVLGFLWWRTCRRCSAPTCTSTKTRCPPRKT